MFQEKEMYFFEKHSRKVNAQKVVVLPKMTTGEVLTDNLYDIIEENSRKSLFENNIIPSDRHHEEFPDLMQSVVAEAPTAKPNPENHEVGASGSLGLQKKLTNLIRLRIDAIIREQRREGNPSNSPTNPANKAQKLNGGVTQVKVH